MNTSDNEQTSINNKYIDIKKQSNEYDSAVEQIKISTNLIEIKNIPSVIGKKLGYVYKNELYNVLDITEDDIYIWYNIKTSNGITGFIKCEKENNSIEFIPKDILLEENTDTNNMFTLLFTCSKEDYYYLKLYKGESLYIKKQSN